MPKKHVCPEPEPDNSKAWLDSYADAMTLLLAFFILLFAFSLVDQKKFQEFKAGVHLAAGKAAPTLDGGNGILELGNGVSSQIATPPVLTDGEKAPPAIEEDIEELLEALKEIDEIGDKEAEDLYDVLEEAIETIGAGDFVELERTARGVVVRMDSKVLYQSGSALILPDGVTILTTLAPVLDAVDNAVVIEGHTDSQPTNGGGGFPTNWELSTARAVSVLRYLNEVMEIPAVRLSASGHADTRPRATNETPEGRAENRRVELVVLIENDDIDIIDQLGDFAEAPPSAEDPFGEPGTESEGVGDEPSDPPQIIDLSPDIDPNFPSTG